MPAHRFRAPQPQHWDDRVITPSTLFRATTSRSDDRRTLETPPCGSEVDNARICVD